MSRSRAPAYGPRRFETRYGECTIEQGVLRLDQGISRLFRRYVTAARERDLATLGKGAAVVVGFVLTAQPGIRLLIAGIDAVRGTVLADPVTALLAGFTLAAALYPLARRWYADRGPSEIRCSEIESVSLDDDTVHVRYRDGPATETRTIRMPKADTGAETRRAREAFEEKGFLVER